MGKFKEDKTREGNLLGYYVEDFLPEGHIAYVVDEIVNNLDTKQIEEKYKEIGQRAYHPKTLIKILFLGYATGIFSSRQLARACRRDVAFMYVARLYKPDFRTISEFRKNNLKELNKYFVEIVKYCSLIGMKTVGKIAIDGSKIRANASSKRTKDIEGYEKWERKIREQIEELQKRGIEKDIEEEKKGEISSEKVEKEIRRREVLLEKIEEAKKKLEEMEERKAKINSTDEDANYMKERTGVIRTNYNVQIATTEDQIIIANDVTNEAWDVNQLKPMMEKIEENTEEKVEEALLDAGYASYENYNYLDEKKIDGYMPDKEYKATKNLELEGKENPYDKKNFKYNEERDIYICPEGKEMEFYKIKEEKKIYRSKECAFCPVREKCTEGKYRTVSRHKYEYLQERMREKLSTAEGKAKYNLRMWMTEPIFGHFKKNLKFTQFLLRGIEKVKGEFNLLCIGYNIFKIWRWRLKTA